MFRLIANTVGSAGCFSLLAGGQRGNAQDQFKLPCAQPHYPAPSVSGLVIDAQCVVQGAGTEVDDNPAEGDQNRAKNNFCAEEDGGAVTTANMKTLQNTVEKDSSINFGRSGSNAGPTKDRTKLQNLGQLSEGKMVVFTGYVLKARQEQAESVNCELGKAAKGKKPKSTPALNALHDIHISLVDSKTTKNECQSIVAEMSPHHRPVQWDQPNVDKVRKKHLKVRVTGQLFFDSSHNLPCMGGQPPSGSTGNPVRVSLWEIHPIYTFEVCPKGTCATSGWQALSDWVNAN